MMDKKIIAQQEAANDGMSIYLYFDNMAGVYLAFGLSAYYVTMVIEPYMSFSEEMQVPVALLRKEHIVWLRQGLRLVEYQPKSFCRFQTKDQIGRDGYDKWAQKILSK